MANNLFYQLELIELEECSTCAIISQVRLEGNRKLFAFSKLNIPPSAIL
jgi:hypothetical protein